MPKITIVIGAILTLLGVVWYTLVSSESWTALIPSIIGLPILLLGFLAMKEGMRKHAMHAAAAIALIGFLGSAKGIVNTAKLIAGAEVLRPRASVVQGIVAVLLGVFLVLCINSFIQARRARTVSAADDE